MSATGCVWRGQHLSRSGTSSVIFNPKCTCTSPAGLQSHSPPPCLSRIHAHTQAGLVPEERAYRANKSKPPSGVVAPETAGLPVDDAFNHLALLRRYVVYGPTLGMTAQQQQSAQGGVGPAASVTGLGGGGGALSRDVGAGSPVPVSSSGMAPGSRGDGGGLSPVRPSMMGSPRQGSP